jgi:class 3 adenylate cyclase
VSLGIAHGLSVPLRELAAGTAAIRAGDLAVRVPVRSGDDLGQLAESFNEMAEGLGQRERYRTVLNMVADEKVAKALVDGQLALGGELREISVLFCDIRGFTPYTQNMPPEEVIEMLNEHMTALTRVVKEHNGVLDKFVGDLLMAIFGAPISHENDTMNAALCALALMRERENLNVTSRHQLKIGIGIATGRVVAGCMGSLDRLNYTVLGERVNLASRLCNQAGPGQIVIDQTTRERLGDVITVTPLPALNLKGFSENVVAYELIRRKSSGSAGGLPKFDSSGSRL